MQLRILLLEISYYLYDYVLTIISLKAIFALKLFKEVLKRILNAKTSKEISRELH